MIRIPLKYYVLCLTGGLALFASAISIPPENDWKISGPFGGTATTVAVDPQNPKTLLAGALSTLLYRSDDYGKSWEPLRFPQQQLGEITPALIDPVDPAHYL